MIKSTNLSDVTHEDFFQIISLTLVFLKKENLDELKLKEAYSALEKAFNAFDEAFKQTRKTGLVDLKEEIDSMRDNLVIGFYQTASALLRFPNEPTRQAAQRIVDVIAHYGGTSIAYMPQKEETAAITNLLQNISGADLAATGTTRWAERLENENNRFAEVLAQKTEKQAQYVAGLLMEERKNTDTRFRLLCKTIDSLAFIFGAEPYQTLAGNINQLVANAQQAVKQKASARETARKKKQEQEQQQEEEQQQ